MKSEVARSVRWCIRYKQPGWGWGGAEDEDKDEEEGDRGDESSALAGAGSPDEVWSVLQFDGCYLA